MNPIPFINRLIHITPSTIEIEYEYIEIKHRINSCIVTYDIISMNSMSLQYIY